MNALIKIQKLILIRMNLGAQKTVAQKVKGVRGISPSNTHCNDLNMSPSRMFVVLLYFPLLVYFWRETENAFKVVEYQFDLSLIFSHTLVQENVINMDQMLDFVSFINSYNHSVLMLICTKLKILIEK